MLKFLILKICIIYLINTALSGEKLSINLPVHYDAIRFSNTINPESIRDLSNNDYINGISAKKKIIFCNETQVCENGGSCLQHVCQCLPGTSGQLCENIDDCRNERLCRTHEDTLCRYSVEEQKAYCMCRVMEYRFDDASKTCRDCECTPTFNQNPSSFSYCEYRQGEQICTCTEGYAPNPRNPKEIICDRCDCGPNSTWCGFDRKGNRICECIDGYVGYSERCLECDCGKHGRCTLTGYRFKKCECDPGYEEYNSKCVKCSCGKYGKCIFNSEGEQTGCECLPGYADKFGKCEMCYCGENINCSFFESGNKRCGCQSGFENINGFCTDINECERHNPCNVTTRCINTIGSYKCICDKGYKRNYTTLLCDDINECQGLTTCSEPYTECINTIGSYKCVCESDFAARGEHVSNTICEKSSSKNIYTVIIAVFAVSLVISSVVIFQQRKYLGRR